MTRALSAPIVTILLCLGLVLPCPAFAHLGPPFPILVDQPIPGYLVTVLANPDVGQAVCIVVLEPGKSAPVASVSEVDVWVRPVSGRLPKAVYRAARDSAPGPLRFVAKPEMDAPEFWTIGVDVHMTDGANHSFVTKVEATPPGIGPWGLLLFLSPFLLFGGLWVMVFVRKARAAAARATESSRADACVERAETKVDPARQQTTPDRP